MLTILRWSGAFRHVASIRSLWLRSLSALISLRQPLQSVIWASTSTQICRCGRTFLGRCQHASQRCARTEASAGRSLVQYSSHWLQLLTLTRLDCGCSTMAGLPARQLNRLQSVLNAATQLVLLGSGIWARAFASPWAIHWLRVPQRIEFRLTVLAYRCLNGTAPQYLTDEVAASCRHQLAQSAYVLRRRCYCTFHGRNTS